ncbi:hypothetical protein LWI29_032318 [Acer saccharum]|uniref:Uncharacterized protein n=1 Tax=Acer saccharum TaxID=4024 RepID=A0AA39T8B4_ACESA|nr:hypothetical protein LWI29_032318 [Acer saccharum]
MAAYASKFADRGVKLLGLSCDDVKSHNQWIKDVEAHTVGFLINDVETHDVNDDSSRSEAKNDDVSDDLSGWEVENVALSAFQFDRMDESDTEAHDLSGEHLLPPHPSLSLPRT